jgi:predicted acylesterase/phospholipase RssA
LKRKQGRRLPRVGLAPGARPRIGLAPGARPRIGLALAGGGPLGAIYEIGALCAIDEALRGLELTALAGYVGVSAGGFVAAGLANRMTPRDLCASFIDHAAGSADLFDPSLLMQPAWDEYWRRAAALPTLTAQAAYEYFFRRRSRMAAFERLGRALPAGIFSGDAMRERLASIFSEPGRTDDFRQLHRKLVLVATDLDSGEAVPFGQPGLDDVPISLAVQASAALPGLYAPVEVNGRTLVDGALKKTLHASVLLDEGLDLLLCLNPLVPFDATHAPRRRVVGQRRAAPELTRPPRGVAVVRDRVGAPLRHEERIPRLADGGLPVVLSQTFRSLIHSRLELGMKGYEQTHPQTDIVLLEPDHRDAELFLASVFSWSQRRALAEHAYQRTRELLRSQRSTLGARLARHGIAIDHAVLDDEHRHLLGRPRRGGPRTARALRRLEETLADLESATATTRK